MYAQLHANCNGLTTQRENSQVPPSSPPPQRDQFDMERLADDENVEDEFKGCGWDLLG